MDLLIVFKSEELVDHLKILPEFEELDPHGCSKFKFDQQFEVQNVQK